MQFHKVTPVNEHSKIPFVVFSSQNKQIREGKMGIECGIHIGFWWGNLKEPLILKI
jgi:hypothetical protein